jgi:hypothetical protein
MWLRFAPGFLPPYSDIQTGDPIKDHDPFDPRRVEAGAFKLTPLIYSAGPDGVYGLGTNTGAYTGNPFDNASITLGQPLAGKEGNVYDNITNHHIEAR